MEKCSEIVLKATRHNEKFKTNTDETASHYANGWEWIFFDLNGIMLLENGFLYFELFFSNFGTERRSDWETFFGRLKDILDERKTERLSGRSIHGKKYSQKMQAIEPLYFDIFRIKIECHILTFFFLASNKYWLTFCDQ